ncbi:YhcH/YjgK/YiaL family protein [Sulfuriroseicoccus oceanibius]|uniref:YhcH/YjgK/YiaL family protein n=1 Tax=Sulfuriroseicoccus oceanibius TaxID=2707525 RepID=A0A6B3LC04_9BACT|nr:YhcH/YjgK/YiaL family protein [Sulfuriroseicoccus oceanibius]QQL45846.1 YhcH/YjgK/YiaL family protein [Sulfuriroseicoccus oceanibius]
MILDVLGNAPMYYGLNGGFAKAFEFLSRGDLGELELGKHEIDGDRVFAVVDEAQGRSKEGALMETHRKYIDVQLILEGTDEMGWKPISQCTQPADEYNAEGDAQMFADAPDVWTPVQAGMFAIFFPEDAHLPLVSDGRIRKVIAKVAVDQSV